MAVGVASGAAEGAVGEKGPPTLLPPLLLLLLLLLAVGVPVETPVGFDGWSLCVLPVGGGVNRRAPGESLSEAVRGVGVGPLGAEEEAPAAAAEVVVVEEEGNKH